MRKSGMWSSTKRLTVNVLHTPYVPNHSKNINIANGPYLEVKLISSFALHTIITRINNITWANTKTGYFSVTWEEEVEEEDDEESHILGVGFNFTVHPLRSPHWGPPSIPRDAHSYLVWKNFLRVVKSAKDQELQELWYKFQQCSAFQQNTAILLFSLPATFCKHISISNLDSSAPKGAWSYLLSGPWRYHSGILRGRRTFRNTGINFSSPLHFAF